MKCSKQNIHVLNLDAEQLVPADSVRIIVGQPRQTPKSTAGNGGNTRPHFSRGIRIAPIHSKDIAEPSLKAPLRATESRTRAIPACSGVPPTITRSARPATLISALETKVDLGTNSEHQAKQLRNPFAQLKTTQKRMKSEQLSTTYRVVFDGRFQAKSGPGWGNLTETRRREAAGIDCENPYYCQRQ